MTEERKVALKSTPFDALAFAPRFAYGHQAEVAEVTGAGDGTQLGTGFARFKDAEIPWTIKYDEVLPVIEGHVTVRTPTGDFEAGPRDCIWLPNGTQLTYISSSALVFYTIYPSDWAAREP